MPDFGKYEISCEVPDFASVRSVYDVAEMWATEGEDAVKWWVGDVRLPSSVEKGKKFVAAFEDESGHDGMFAWFRYCNTETGQSSLFSDPVSYKGHRVGER